MMLILFDFDLVLICVVGLRSPLPPSYGPVRTPIM
jgi:hypothetical protein